MAGQAMTTRRSGLNCSNRLFVRSSAIVLSSLGAHCRWSQRPLEDSCLTYSISIGASGFFVVSSLAMMYELP